jgi:hypothetical protein
MNSHFSSCSKNIFQRCRGCGCVSPICCDCVINYPSKCKHCGESADSCRCGFCGGCTSICKCKHCGECIHKCRCSFCGLCSKLCRCKHCGGCCKCCGCARRCTCKGACDCCEPPRPPCPPSEPVCPSPCDLIDCINPCNFGTKELLGLLILSQCFN